MLDGCFVVARLLLGGCEVVARWLLGGCLMIFMELLKTARWIFGGCYLVARWLLVCCQVVVWMLHGGCLRCHDIYQPFWEDVRVLLSTLISHSESILSHSKAF